MIKAETIIYQENTNGFHRREVAEQILKSSDVLPLMYDPLSSPVAGLAAFTHEHSGSGTVTPRELLSETYMPVVILDLDDTVWKHAELLVRAVGEASNVPITMEYFREIGHTRKIPEWKDDTNIMAIHDEIVGGVHPTFFPYVNRACPMAAATIEAIDRMGHHFLYLTARPPELLDATRRVMEWNRLTYNYQAQLTDAKNHDVPKRGFLYFAPDPKTSTEYKGEVIEQWLSNLRNSGWKGSMVIIDDLLKPFQGLIESGQVIGVSLEGDLNSRRTPYEKEVRAASWYDISDTIMEIHKQALAVDPKPYREFDCAPQLPGVRLLVNKEASGVGKFDLEQLPTDAYAIVASNEWETNPESILAKIGVNR